MQLRLICAEPLPPHGQKLADAFLVASIGLLEFIACTYSRLYGGPEVLQVAEVAMPVPKRHEVRIKVKATGRHGERLHRSRIQAASLSPVQVVIDCGQD